MSGTNNADDDFNNQNLNHLHRPNGTSHLIPPSDSSFILELQEAVNRRSRVTNESEAGQPHEERYADKVVRWHHLQQARLKQEREEKAAEERTTPSDFASRQKIIHQRTQFPSTTSPRQLQNFGLPPSHSQSRLNPAAIEWNPPVPRSIFLPPLRFDSNNQVAVPSSSGGTLLVYTELDYIKAEQQHTSSEVIPRLRRLPVTSFRGDGSVDIDLTWAIHALGYAHFEGAHGQRSRLRSNSWMRTQGIQYGLPEIFIRWLSGEILGGVLHIPADKARQFWAYPQTE